mmetsp:Transcript_3908/g.14763  ORF Transcript_3908/g.14763 Transcript_3908/m.14763 type:complete len:172 (+) Transcript_3908:3857-4372(+)
MHVQATGFAKVLVLVNVNLDSMEWIAVNLLVFFGLVMTPQHVEAMALVKHTISVIAPLVGEERTVLFQHALGAKVDAKMEAFVLEGTSAPATQISPEHSVNFQCALESARRIPWCADHQASVSSRIDALATELFLMRNARLHCATAIGELQHVIIRWVFALHQIVACVTPP